MFEEGTETGNLSQKERDWKGKKRERVFFWKVDNLEKTNGPFFFRTKSFHHCQGFQKGEKTTTRRVLRGRKGKYSWTRGGGSLKWEKCRYRKHIGGFGKKNPRKKKSMLSVLGG